MPTRRRLRFVNGQLAWMLATILLLSLVSSLTYELFFVGSFVGFLVLVDLTAPFNVTPRWRTRLKWLVAIGLAAFAYVVIRRTLTILAPGAM